MPEITTSTTRFSFFDSRSCACLRTPPSVVT